MKDNTISELVATWEEISKAKGGHIFMDRWNEGMRFVILKGGSSLCAYVGFPLDHPLSGFNYDDIPVRAHGGLTFSGSDNKSLPAGYYFYGWDYAHCNDYCDYYDREPLVSKFDHSKDKKWLVEDVEKDSWETIWDFKSLMKLSEAIATKYLFNKNNL